MKARPVVTIVSQATRLYGSWDKIASRMASEIWSAILSGWPSVTDSEVKRCRPFFPILCPPDVAVLKCGPSGPSPKGVRLPPASEEGQSAMTHHVRHITPSDGTG